VQAFCLIAGVLPDNTEAALDGPAPVPRVAVDCGVVRLGSFLPGRLGGLTQHVVLHYCPIQERLTVITKVLDPPVEPPPPAERAGAGGGCSDSGDSDGGNEGPGHDAFQTLCEDSVDAIRMTDRQGFIVYASRRTSQLFGMEHWELIGAAAGDSLHPSDRDNIRRSAEMARTHAFLPSPEVIERAYRGAQVVERARVGAGPGAVSTARFRGVFRAITSDGYDWVDSVVTYRYEGSVLSHAVNHTRRLRPGVARENILFRIDDGRAVAPRPPPPDDGAADGA